LDLTGDGRLLFAARTIRLFAYGLLAVVLVLYLTTAGLTTAQVGLLFLATLVGDTLISLYLTTHADRAGRRRTLLVGASLMLLAAVAFALTRNMWLLTLAATVGVISPSGGEVGPFLAVEQAALSKTVGEERRTHVFAWYNLVGSFATALGALCGGALVAALQRLGGLTPLASYRGVVLLYGALGILLALLFSRLSPGAEADEGTHAADERPAVASDPLHAWLGLHASRRIVLRLSGLFALDAFAGGLVVQSFLAYWFHARWGVSPAVIGSIFFGANVLAGVSALSAAWLAKRIGLVNTMVFTHLPSNVLLILVPLMPSLPLAIAVLLLRFSISQMDVPTRQAYVMAAVAPDERSAAAGVTGIARTVGTSIGPLIAGPLLGSAALFSLPFFLAGGLKIVYDLLLWKNVQEVVRVPPP
jgi:MFS family permease